MGKFVVLDAASDRRFDCGEFGVGDIAGNGLSKLFMTIAAAFAEAERDRIRERIGQVKPDQKARGRYLGGKVPFGYRWGDSGEVVPHEAEQGAIREMIALRAEGETLRAIATAMAAKGYRISHEGVPRSYAWRPAHRNGPFTRALTLRGAKFVRASFDIPRRKAR